MHWADWEERWWVRVRARWRRSSSCSSSRVRRTYGVVLPGPSVASEEQPYPAIRVQWRPSSSWSKLHALHDFVAIRPLPGSSRGVSNNGIELVARRPELVPRFVRKRSTEYDMYDKEITRLQAINSSGLTEEEKSLFCRLVAWDPADNQYVLVLEYCEGGDLEGLLQQQPSEVDLPLATVLRWAESLALALDVMHRKLGRLHLDLKPANLLLPSANPSAAEIKVADFGISQVCPMSHDGHWEGTVSAEYPMLEHAFSAPEQGSECGVSPATDRYQLGLVLLQLLCRRRLEDMGDMQALLQCRPNLVYDINRRGFGNCEFKKLPADLQARWKPIGTVEAKAEMDKLPHRGGPLAQLVLDLLRTEPKDRPSEIIKRIKAAK